MRLAIVASIFAGLTFSFADNASPAKYFPLAEGDRWVFHVTIPRRVKPEYRLVRTITRVGGDAQAGADARSGPVYAMTEEDYSIPKGEWPEEPLEYSIRENGDIYCAKCGGFVLKSPLEPQQSWTSSLGYGPDVSRVIAVHKPVMAGGKLYRDCVVVESTSGEEHTVTSYAAGVGPVRVEVFQGVSKQAVRREELVSFSRNGAR
jgi:hypothetical protein